jgi:hypothetical protein
MDDNKKQGTDGILLAELLSLGEAFGKIAASITVMGYMSARWHWNLLGISALKPLSLSAYLAETLFFVVQTLWRLLLTGSFLLVVFVMLIYGLRAIRLFLSPLPGSISSSTWAGWIVVALSSVFALILIHLASLPGDLLVGSIDKDVADRLTKYIWLQSVVNSTYELLWFTLVAFGFLLAKHYAVPRNGTGSILLTWQIARVPVIVGFLTLPMIFGTYIRPILYPAAAVSWKIDKKMHSICGVLVGNEAGSVLLWHQDRSYGAVLKIPEQAITSLATGPLIRPLAIRGEPEGSDAHILIANCTRLRERLNP